MKCESSGCGHRDSEGDTPICDKVMSDFPQSDLPTQFECAS